jgi:ribosomal silencing factor RsfS
VSTDGSERRVLSRKELAKEKRHAIYQAAKERRATDPRYVAMKEAAKVQRRAAYQKVKEHRKALAAEEKAKQKAERAAQSTSRRIEADQGLWQLVTWTSKAANQQQ